MAREKMITRTIIATKYNVLTMDTETAEIMEKEYFLSDKMDSEKALKVLRKRHETETFKIVSIKSTENIETLYGMPETEFMQYAKILPPRKVYEI